MRQFMSQHFRMLFVVGLADNDMAEPTVRRAVACVTIDGGIVFALYPQTALPHALTNMPKPRHSIAYHQHYTYYI